MPPAPAEALRSPHARVVIDTGRASADALVDALDELASSVRLSVSRGALRRSVSIALAARAPVEWTGVLRSAGATLGVSVRTYVLSPSEVAAHAASLPPLVTLVERADRLVAIAVFPGRGGLTLFELRRGGRPTSTEPRALAELLGVPPDAPAVFVAAEPAATLT